MYRCSNCLIKSKDVIKPVANRDYYVCPKCSVTYGKNRGGDTFVLDEEVNINNYHPGMDNRVLIVKGIYIFEESESGRMVLLEDKGTGKKTKSIFDINWLLKINNKN